MCWFCGISASRGQRFCFSGALNVQLTELNSRFLSTICQVFSIPLSVMEQAWLPVFCLLLSQLGWNFLIFLNPCRLTIFRMLRCTSLFAMSVTTKVLFLELLVKLIWPQQSSCSNYGSMLDGLIKFCVHASLERIFHFPQAIFYLLCFRFILFVHVFYDAASCEIDAFIVIHKIVAEKHYKLSQLLILFSATCYKFCSLIWDPDSFEHIIWHTSSDQTSVDSFPTGRAI